MIDFKHYKGAWAGLIFASALALFLNALIASGVRNGLRSGSFPTVPGVITRSELEGGHKGASDYEVEYQYDVGGALYTGREYHVQPQFLHNGYWLAAHDANPVGQAVTVYYDPADPATAYLVPGVRSDILFVGWWATAVNLLALGLGLNALDYLRGRRAFDPVRRRCVRETPDGWTARPDPTSRFAVTSFVSLLAIFGAGCFVTMGYAVVFTRPAPWIVPLALYAVAPVFAVRFGRHFSREGLFVINDREGTVAFVHHFARVTVPRGDLICVGVTTRACQSDGVPFEAFAVSLNWRDKFEQKQSTALATYIETADVEALVGWLAERLQLPVAAPTKM